MSAQHEEKNPDERHGRTIEVFYGDTAYDLKPGSYSGSELATIFAVPAGYVLDLVNDDNVFQDVSPTQRLVLRDGMKFASHPPVGRSS